MEDPNYRALMDYAMRALGQRAHTTHELKIKLKKRPQFSMDLCKQVIARLVELDLLNDEKYIRNTVQDAANFKYSGLLKVAHKLHQRGISMDQTQAIWSEMQVNEKEIAEKALSRITKKLSLLPREKRYAKKAQYLASRGFSPQIIFQLVRTEDFS